MKTSNEYPIGIPAGRRVDRRGFLRLAVVTAGAVAAAERFSMSLPQPSTATAPSSFRLAGAATLAPGETRAVPLGDSGRSALVARLDANALVAFDRRCPHLGCPVVWSKGRGRFECPCHAAAFDARTGRVLFGPPRRGLEPLAVETRGDDLWIHTPAQEVS